MKKVTLKGKTSKGKSRVGSFGNSWGIIKEHKGMLFDGIVGNWLLLRPTSKPDSDLRWVCEKNDKDFEVIK